MINVLVAEIPETIEGQIRCKQRIEEINSCKSQAVKKQKLFAWLTLEKLAHNLGFLIDDISFFKDEGGKWFCNEFHFSISHSHNYVAVAISNNSVGLDLQKVVEVDSKRLAQKILTNEEILKFSSLDSKTANSFIIEKWTQKESIYKLFGTQRLSFKDIDCTNYNLYTSELTLNGEAYKLAVASQSLSDLQVDIKN